jgi:hypothetical protein
MTSRTRRLLRWVAAHWIGDHVVPVGGVAGDRRLLRRGLTFPVGRALVVGPSTAARQAMRGSHVDVAGTSPHAAEITVCSTVRDPGALPPGRWNTVIVTESTVDLRQRLQAIAPACLPGARLLILERDQRSRTANDHAQVAQLCALESTLERGSRRLLVARMPS